MTATTGGRGPPVDDGGGERDADDEFGADEEGVVVRDRALDGVGDSFDGADLDGGAVALVKEGCAVESVLTVMLVEYLDVLVVVNTVPDAVVLNKDGVNDMPADLEAETLGVPEGDSETEPEVGCVSVPAEDAETEPEEADEAEMVMHPVADPDSTSLLVIEAV